MATYYVELNGGSIAPSTELTGGGITPTAQFQGGDIYPGGGGGSANLTTKSVTYTPTSSIISDTLTPPSGYDGFSQVDVTVNAIPSAPEKKLVNFIDYDGSIVYSYTAAEFASLSALPANPTHTDMGLVPDGWNWTLAEIQTQLTAMPNQKVWVGQCYHTASGATEIDIKLEDASKLSFYILLEVRGSVTLDWGDGSATESITGMPSSFSSKTASHTYSSTGEYTIKITTADKYRFKGFSPDGALQATVASRLAHIIKAIRCGVGIDMASSYPLTYGGKNIDYITTTSSAPFSTSNGDSYANGSSIKAVVFPRSDTVGSAFKLCPYLETASLPGNIEVLQDTFESCVSLANVTFVSTINSIPSGSAFMRCPFDAEIVFNNTMASLASSVFTNASGIRKITLNSNLTTIAQNNFSGCTNLEEVKDFPINATSIPNSLFSGCAKLKKFRFTTGTSNIQIIDQYSFSGCISLEDFTIPSTVTTIGQAAFTQCYGLKKIVIPSNVTSIGSSAFSTCNGVSEIWFEPTTPPVLGSSTSIALGKCTIYVPSGSLSAYTSAQYYPTSSNYTYVEY